MLSSPIAVQPTFLPDLPGSYELSLVVNDGTVDSLPDTVSVIAASENSAPVANAGPDQNVATGTEVVLDGRASSDADADTLTYHWAFVSMPAGSAATLSSTSTVQPTFVADRDGSYVLSLVVNDGRVDSAADRVTVTAATQNSAPVANAGPDQNVATGTEVVLDGRASSDADADTLTYHWAFVSMPADSAATLSSTSTVQPTFIADRDGSYVLGLVVNDGRVSSIADTVVIMATTRSGTCAYVQGGGPVANDVAVLPDGSLVVLGATQLSRFASDASSGQLLATWTVPLGNSSQAVAVQSDGKILVAGKTPLVRAEPPGQGVAPTLTLRRFDSNGATDPSFGSNGLVSVVVGLGPLPTALAVQPDGKILMLGRVASTTGTNSDLILLRFDSNGALDVSFGSGGVVKSGLAGADVGNDLKLQLDGKIVVVGSVQATTQDVMLLRFQANGSLDLGFGVNGIVRYDGGEADTGEGVALDPDGNIIVAATTTIGGQTHVLLLRYNGSVGSFDRAFGSSGVAIGGLGQVHDMALQSDGQIVVAGETTVQGNAYPVAMIARYDASGSLDASFGSGGTMVFDGGEGAERADALALATDGSVIAAGASSDLRSTGGTAGQLLLMKVFDVCR